MLLSFTVGWQRGTASLVGLAAQRCRFSCKCCLFSHSPLTSRIPPPPPQVWTGSNSAHQASCVWARLRAIWTVDSFYMKWCSGNGPAVMPLLLLAWSPTFFPNPRDIRSCSLDVMALRLRLLGYLPSLAVSARWPAFPPVPSSVNKS